MFDLYELDGDKPVLHRIFNVFYGLCTSVVGFGGRGQPRRTVTHTYHLVPNAHLL